MAAQTGSTYISGTMIDSVEIPTAKRGFSTMTSSNKLPNDYNKPNAYANVIRIQMLVVMTTTSGHLASLCTRSLGTTSPVRLNWPYPPKNCDQ